MLHAGAADEEPRASLVEACIPGRVSPEVDSKHCLQLAGGTFGHLDTHPRIAPVLQLEALFAIDGCKSLCVLAGAAPENLRHG